MIKKWCDKTCTSSYRSNSEIYMGDPAGNFQNRTLAQMSPEPVLEGDSPRLIDEWQALGFFLITPPKFSFHSSC